jgi:bacteriocin-like protein
MKKQQQPSPQKPKTPQERQPVQELTDEQLKEVTGGLNPQPLPPGKLPPELT